MRLLQLAVVVTSATAPVSGEQPAITVYNNDFAVVRETVRLDLKKGVNEVSVVGTPAHLEPDSVMLRDRAAKFRFRIREQSYRAKPVSTNRLLQLSEGKTIEFLLPGAIPGKTVVGKIIRAGRKEKPSYDYWGTYVEGWVIEPIVEVNGKLRFELPGKPIFPPLDDAALLRPTLRWLIEVPQAGAFDAELGYITGALSWHADYNVVLPSSGDRFDLVGWVTIDNNCGKTFEKAHWKLMAGDVHKIKPQSGGSGGMGGGGYDEDPAVTEKKFDEYHLYTLKNPMTLHDGETKQVQFIRSTGVAAESKRIYVYDGALLPKGWEENALYGQVVRSNRNVAVFREFVNSKDNQLGVALPKGRLRVYRRDSDDGLEFVGEDAIDHTPAGETVRIRTGNAFDLVGERRQTSYEQAENSVDEAFEIKLRNRSEQNAEILVVEHLYGWHSWEIRKSSQDFEKRDSRTITFIVNVPAGAERIVTYEVHYKW